MKATINGITIEGTPQEITDMVTAHEQAKMPAVEKHPVLEGCSKCRPTGLCQFKTASAYYKHCDLLNGNDVRRRSSMYSYNYSD